MATHAKAAAMHHCRAAVCAAEGCCERANAASPANTTAPATGTTSGTSARRNVPTRAGLERHVGERVAGARAVAHVPRLREREHRCDREEQCRVGVTQGDRHHRADDHERRPAHQPLAHGAADFVGDALAFGARRFGPGREFQLLPQQVGIGLGRRRGVLRQVHGRASIGVHTRRLHPCGSR